MEAYGINIKGLDEMEKIDIEACINTLSGLLNFSQRSGLINQEKNSANLNRWGYEQALTAAIESLQKRLKDCQLENQEH